MPYTHAMPFRYFLCYDTRDFWVNGYRDLCDAARVISFGLLYHAHLPFAAECMSDGREASIPAWHLLRFRVPLFWIIAFFVQKCESL